MIKKIILHIGCEKTGTTSIQNTLFLNRKLLLEREAILYPRSLGDRNHWKLALYTCDEDKSLIHYLPEGKTISEYRAELRKEFIDEVKSSNAEKVLISNEWLHPRVRSEDEFNRLRSLLNEVTPNVEVLMYIRRQDNMALSLYSTSLKAGNYQRFDFPQVNTEQNLPYYYDFLSIYRNWKKFFGPGNVYIRVYDREKLYMKDAVNDFTYFLGFKDGYTNVYRDANQSLGNIGILLIRGLNFILNRIKKFVSPILAIRLRRGVALMLSGKANIKTEQQSNNFYKKFIKSNRTLELEYERDSHIHLKIF